jgi:hypothetical protein
MNKAHLATLALCISAALGPAAATAAEPSPQAPARVPLPTPPPEAPAGPGAFPPLSPVEDASQLGLGVQRTMTLLAASTPEHRNHVRVLFYGQSITEQEWSKQVAEDLRKRFPNADLEIENRAIGGFASQLLIRPAEHDVYPFYPDLVIFHVFGANQQYEQIIKNIRSRTTAEVLMQLDRVGAKWPQTQPDEKADKGLWWDYLMNHRFLPDIAKKYGCGLEDVRTGWLQYLRDNHYEPGQLLLKDGAHLNAQGNFLLAQLTDRYLAYRPDLPDAEWKGLTHDYPVTTGDWKDGKLSIEFEGNRVDVIPAKGQSSGGEARVLIDGKKPSEFPSAYRITRPQPGPWSPLFLARVDHDTPLVLEDWTLKVKDVSPDGKTWGFDLIGSVTGPDGSGRSDQPFTSTSGRVKIDPAAWFRGFNPPLPDGYTIHWKVLPMFVDTFQVPKIDDPAKENATVVVQGIANGKHTLELVADDASRPPGIGVVRTYKPPVKGE